MYDQLPLMVREIYHRMITFLRIFLKIYFERKSHRDIKEGEREMRAGLVGGGGR